MDGHLPGTDYPPPGTDLTADVAVIGGGIVGLCTAWELRRRAWTSSSWTPTGSPPV
nr:FAD-dependent oxidoreductase [Streptomyces halobius]